MAQLIGGVFVKMKAKAKNKLINYRLAKTGAGEILALGGAGNVQCNV